MLAPKTEDKDRKRDGNMRHGKAPILVAALLLTLLSQTALGLKVVTYNILNFPGTTGSAREDDFIKVCDELEADIIVVQEMLSQTGTDQFLDDILNYTVPGTYAAGPFVNGYDTDNALFYRTATVDYISHQEISTALRNISEYVLRPVGYSSSDAELTIYSLHLKAGSTSTDQTKRLAEATILRNHMNNHDPDAHFMVAGDLNIRGSSESAYQKFVGSEANNNGRVKDPINRPGYWHDSYTFRDIHTQSPRTTQFGGGATGGMDDRFDQVLISYPLDDGDGLSYVSGSHVAYGNDGGHLNQAINYGTNYAVGSVIADALHEASDHIPVYADFQVPAKLDCASSLAFGEVIIGAVSEQILSVGNSAVSPADDLDYSFSAPSGFEAPAGGFSEPSGGSSGHSISMNTSSAGAQAGDLTVSSNDVDLPAASVALSGTVLNHAAPSLAAADILLVNTLDFGTHHAGDFDQMGISIHNFEYDSLQALLEIYDAEIVGGGGVFSIVGGFSAQEVGSTPADYRLVFDDASAPTGVVYEAVLTFSTRDLPGIVGGVMQDDLTIHLSACPLSGTSVPSGPTCFALAPGRPNPFTDATVLQLSLPTATKTRVLVFDISGRLVRTLVSEILTAGDHAVPWDGRDDHDELVASGIYLIRADAGEWRQSRKTVLLR